MDTVGFLRHVWPDEGWKCTAVKLTKGYHHHWTETAEEAAAYMLQMDAEGHTVYFAISVFKTNANRRGENVLATQVLPLDIDVGDDKAYKTRAEASAALTEFLVKHSLPDHTIVHSGPQGLHGYLVLDEALPPERWKALALAYKDLCMQSGFHIDPSRSADLAGVMRPPGTHHRKGSPYPVQVVHVAETFWARDLAFKPQVHAQRTRQHGLIEYAAIYNNAPSDPHKVAAGCAQIAELRDKHGDVSYDQWFNTLRVLHHCTNGDEVAHDWSSGHRTYSEEETQRKLDEDGPPVRCTTFHRANPNHCLKCSSWGKISTPLQLGRMTVPAVYDQINGHPAASIFINDEHGLRMQTDKKGKTAEILISRWPIEVRCVARGERNADEFAVLLDMVTPHMGKVPLQMSAGVFFSSQGMPDIHLKGAVIHEPELLRKYVRQQMDSFHERSEPQTRYDQFGWKDHDNAFLFGNQLYTPTQILPCVGSPEVERRARLLGPRGGSLKAWTAAANQLFATGCEPHSFALCCAFGAVLMHFHSEEGGAIVNLVSEQSATGKTTGLEAIASVWGEMDGTRLTDDDTKVSRGLLLGTLGNLPCVFDELHKRDPDVIRQFVIMFTNGRDKRRGRSDGTLREPAGSWQTILVLGSNVSIVDIMQAQATEEAQAYRILEFVATQNFTTNDGDRLRRELRANSGHAGEAYIKFLMQPGVMERVRRELDNAVEALWAKKYGFDKRHRFWVRGIACALVGGRIVNHMGLLNFDYERVINWAIDRCQQRNINEVKRDYVQVLNEALYELYAYTLVVDKEWAPALACLVLGAPRGNAGLYARRVRDSGRMYIARTWLRKWLTEHMVNRTSFINQLTDLKVILNQNRFITLGAGTDHNVGGQIACFEIDMHHELMVEAVLKAEDRLPSTVKDARPLATIIQFARKEAAGSLPPPEALQ